MNKNHAFLNSLVNMPEKTFNKLQEFGTFKMIKAGTIVTRKGERLQNITF